MYEDIIMEPWPRKGTRGRMSMEERAKIFLPFAALKGYEEAIEAKKKIVVRKTDLSEDKKDNLDFRMQLVSEALEAGEHPVITLIYFKKDRESGEGNYLKKTGMLAKLDFNAKYMQLVNDKIDFEDIYDMDGEIFQSVDGFMA